MAEKKTKAKKAETAQDVATMGAAELSTALHKALEQRAKLEFQHNVSPLKNPMELRTTRREIARLKTYLRAKETAK